MNLKDDYEPRDESVFENDLRLQMKVIKKKGKTKLKSLVEKPV